MTPEDLRGFLLEYLAPRARRQRVELSTLQDADDLYAVGLLDSLELVLLLQAIESRFGVAISLQGSNPQEVFTIGGLLKHASITS